MKAETLEAVRRHRATKQPFVLATALATGDQVLVLQDGLADLPGPVLAAARAALQHDRSGVEEIDGARWFLHVYNPPLRLIVVGAVHIAQSLLRMAMLTGYDVTLVDPRRAWATEERFPGLTMLDDWPDDALEKLAPDARTAVVTLTHDPKLDDPALAVALRSPAFYIGALGSRRTHAKRLDRLSEMGFRPGDTGRIHGPIGLDLGGRSPAEIAVSILAQMTQVLHRAGAHEVAAA